MSLAFACPHCTHTVAAGPSVGPRGLPPTGGDYDWIEEWREVVCSACGSRSEACVRSMLDGSHPPRVMSARPLRDAAPPGWRVRRAYLHGGRVALDALDRAAVVEVGGLERFARPGRLVAYDDARGLALVYEPGFVVFDVTSGHALHAPAWLRGHALPSAWAFHADQRVLLGASARHAQRASSVGLLAWAFDQGDTRVSACSAETGVVLDHFDFAPDGRSLLAWSPSGGLTRFEVDLAGEVPSLRQTARLGLAELHGVGRHGADVVVIAYSRVRGSELVCLDGATLTVCARLPAADGTWFANIMGGGQHAVVEVGDQAAERYLHRVDSHSDALSLGPRMLSMQDLLLVGAADHRVAVSDEHDVFLLDVRDASLTSLRGFTQGPRRNEARR